MHHHEDVNEADALKEIQRLAKVGIIVLEPHALDRMDERNVTARDIRKALKGAHSIRRSDPDHRSKWTVGGDDCDGELLELGVNISGGVVVVTVF